jgi:nitroreductase
MRISDSLVERHRAFWDRSAVSRPLCDFFAGGVFSLAVFRGGLCEGLLEPEMIAPEAWEEFYRLIGFAAPMQGDLVEAVYPFAAIPWMEGIMGCPIKVSLSSNSIGADPCLEDLSDLDAVEAAALDPDNPWLVKLLEFQRFLVDAFGAEHPVGLPIMRGPVDLVTAMLGGARAVLEFYDHPKEMERLVRICADVWLQTARAQIDLLPVFQGGYFNYRVIWTPGPSPALQEDNAALLSPTLYRQFIFPQDERILASFTHPFFHTHTATMHIVLDDLLSCSYVKAIDSCWDPVPFGPPVEELIPMYHKIQEAGKSLYILAVGCPDEEALLLLRQELSPRGLCIFFEAPDEPTGRRMAGVLEGAWGE